MHFTCECTDASLAQVFNYLACIETNGVTKTLPMKSDWHTTYELPPHLCRNDYLSHQDKQWMVSRINSFPLAIRDVVSEKTIIMLTVEIPFDERQIDVFSYRYLIMIIRQCLRPQDFAVIKCDFQHYSKIGSYFILESSQSEQLMAYITDDNKGNRLIAMPKVVSLSPEWFPAIYLNSGYSKCYEVLNNPLFDNDKTIENALLFFNTNRESTESNRIDYREQLTKYPMGTGIYYKGYFRKCFENWIGGMIAYPSIIKRLNSVSGMAQLLFALMYKNLYREKILGSGVGSISELENLLETCCDFSDCILQTAENAVSHSKGGVLSIRINNNWDKIADTFEPRNKDFKYLSRYIRISLVDFSEDGVLNTIRKKDGLENVRLAHVFAPDNAWDDQVYLNYQNFLSKPDHVIHHYGLSIFSNVVKQYEGCFTVSSCAKCDTPQTYIMQDSEKVKYVRCGEPIRIPGTEYDILLALDKGVLCEEGLNFNPSLLVDPDYIMTSPRQNIIFNEKILDFFNDPLSSIILKYMADYNNHQNLKEKVVEEAAEELTKILTNEGENVGRLDNCVFYFYLSNVVENVFGRVEIIAKILLQTAAMLKKRYAEKLHLYGVLYGLSENRVISFARQFALFYHRSEGNRLMKDCQLYIVSENYQADVLFAGSELRTISDYCKSRRLVSGTSIGIANILEHVAHRAQIGRNLDKPQSITPLPFDLMYRMELSEGKVSLSSHKKWYYRYLETVLTNDIHSGDLGCCIENVHIRTEAVHLQTFYEGQLLFSNTYWYHIFADYLCEMILKHDCTDKQTKILLYGYETYSEQMLFATVNKLKEQNIPVWYALYENPKYITVSETSETRIRYLNNFIRQCESDKLCIIYIFGIGTTLATIEKRMHTQLQIEFEKLGKNAEFTSAKKKGYVIIQTRKATDDSLSTSEILCDDESHIVKSTQSYLDFLTDKQCRFLTSIAAKWATAEECHLCSPENYLNELPLIQTNETSTIPLLLIKPSGLSGSGVKFYQEKTYSDSFLQDTQNAKYLYYSHLNRSGNHYQFYIRTASLLNDLLESNDEKLNAWFEEIKKTEFSNTDPQIRKISVLVSPLHFSNEAFTAAVNHYVFGGKGYIINFDVKKEFRDSFVAKFRNYRSALEMMTNSKIGIKLELNFYFVDDNIITGATLNRAKSLLSSMIGDMSNIENVSVNMFKGIIVLIDRNSKSTIRNFFDRPMGCNAEEEAESNQQNILPFYRFISLNTPSIRSYGDSCPLCNEVERIKHLEKESSLSFVEQHWRKKTEYHNLKKLSDAKKDRESVNLRHKGDYLYQSRGFRRLQCSEWIWAMLKQEEISAQNAKQKLEQRIGTWLELQKDSVQKIEYLISFLKVISREHIVYQEGINTAALQILLGIFSLYVGDGAQPAIGLYGIISYLISDPNLQKEKPHLIYELYKIVIARLCAMGSMVLCREEQLEACLATGFILEDNCMGMENFVEGGTEIEDFALFLCIQMKKMLFATQDSDFRIRKLQKILHKHLQEEGMYRD